MPDPDQTFRIIGSDHKQYGPVTQTQISEWIKAGRANGQTMTLLEGTTEWKPLNEFPEFSDMIAAFTLPPLLIQEDQRKSKLVAGLLGILLGSIGVHRFYLGYTEIGVAQILVTLITCGAGAVWGLIEGILILVGATITSDAQGRPLRE